MTIDEAFRGLIIGDAILAALIGTRVHAVTAPQNETLPYIVFQRVSVTRQRAFSGPLGLPRLRYRVQAWAKSSDGVNGFNQVRAVADALRALLDGHRGLSSGVDIVDIELETELDGFDDPISTYRVSQDYFVTYCE